MSKKTTEQAIDVASILGDTEALFPPSPDAVPVAANVSMKLPTFWLDAAEVWFAQVVTQFKIRKLTVSKTKFYHFCSCFATGSSLSDLGSHPHSSGWRPLWCTPRAYDHSLHAE